MTTRLRRQWKPWKPTPVARPTLTFAELDAPRSSDPSAMWDESALVLARTKCAYCEGNGYLKRFKGRRPCNCVLRAIFRACLRRYRECAYGGATGTISWEFSPPLTCGRAYSRPWEEYMADFCLIARRMLDDGDYQLIHVYFVEDGRPEVCGERMKLDHGNFFHAVYRIEQILGRAFSETRPYALYPLDEYFSASVKAA